MVKRAPSGARVEALPLSPQTAPLPPGPPSQTVRPRRPGSRETPAGRCLSWGLLGSLMRSARRHGGSGTPGLEDSAPGSGLPASAARISCRGSRAPGAAPSDCTTRARARGRRRRRTFEVCGAPAGSPRPGATLVAPGLRGKWLPGCDSGCGRWTLRPQQLRLCQERGRSIFLGPCTLDFSSFPFYFYIFHLATGM